MFFITLASLASIALAAPHDKRVTCPDGTAVSNAACCNFAALKTDLLDNLFGGVCGEEVHESLRLAFHDAIGFSTSQGPSAGGGADGSPIIFPDVEANFPANLGIIDSIEFLTPFMASHNVTAGDLIQFATAVGITLCPGAPQLKFMAGRPNAKAPSVLGLVPEPQDNMDTILARFMDGGGFTAVEAASLIVSHTIGRSDHIVPGFGAVPFDTTPFTFDSQFFVEIQLRGIGTPANQSGMTSQGEATSPLPQTSGENVGEVRLISDSNFARDSRTACTFQSFVNNHSLMSSMFAAAMQKLALVGQNAAKMVDCSELIPVPLPAVNKPATFPAGKSQSDVEQACATAPFPTLATDPGPATVIPHCPPQQGGDADNCDNDEGSLRRRSRKTRSV